MIKKIPGLCYKIYSRNESRDRFYKELSSRPSEYGTSIANSIFTPSERAKILELIRSVHRPEKFYSSLITLSTPPTQTVGRINCSAASLRRANKSRCRRDTLYRKKYRNLVYSPVSNSRLRKFQTSKPVLYKPPRLSYACTYSFKKTLKRGDSKHGAFKTIR